MSAPAAKKLSEEAPVPLAIHRGEGIVRGQPSQTPPAQTVAKSRLVFLDALRGIAVLLVFGTHALNRISPDFDFFRSHSFDSGNWGVFVFFLCSGFVIPLSLERQASLGRFWVGRIFRLYPLYWVCIVATVLVGASETTAPFAILANFTMAHQFFGIPHVQSTFWSLTIELAFYGAVSLLFALHVHRKSSFIAVAMLLTAAVVEGALLLRGYSLPLELLSSLAGLFLGTVFYRLYQGEVARWQLLAIVALALPVLVGTVWWHRPSYAGPRIAAIVVFSAVFILRERAFPRWLCYVGEISYSIYLSHIIVIHVIGDPGPPALNLLLWLAATVGVSAITYHWIEQPMIGIGRRVAALRRSPALTRTDRETVKG